MFYIKINQIEQYEFDTFGYWGEIKIGEFSEVFFSSSQYWNFEQYRNHWRRELSKIFQGKDKICLITSFSPAKVSRFLFIWKIYRLNEVLYFQNQIMFTENLEIDDSNCSDSISDLQLVNSEGIEISTWVLSVDEMKNFVNNVNNDNY
jgi:CdiI N-terminal domain